MTKKTFLSILLLAFIGLSATMLYAQTTIIAGGTSQGCDWQLTSDSTLTVSSTTDDGCPSFLRGKLPYYYTSNEVPWHGYRTSIKKVIIENGVIDVGQYAFYNCINLTEVSIGNDVDIIDGVAFAGCSMLTSITIPDNIISIDGSAFARCGLTSIIIPNSVVYIYGYAFEGCTNLASVTIGNNVDYIDGGVFKNCTSLTSIAIPSSVTDIGGYVFRGCTALTEINVDNSNQNYTSENGILFNKNKTRLICYPANKTGTSYSIPDVVTHISNYAFEYCSNLISVYITANVTSVGEASFGACASLTLINVADANPNYSAENGVLFDKDKTTLIQYPAGKSGEYSIPNSVNAVNNYAFEYCSGLTSVNIPINVAAIGYSAFKNCTGLQTVTVNWETPLTISLGVFEGVNIASVRLEIPENTYELYSTANVWQNFLIPVSVTAINLNSTFETLSVGQTYQLVGAVIPSNATNQNVSYTSNNESVATVSASGMVTAVGTGIATITVTTEDGHYTATCTIEVQASNGIEILITTSLYLYPNPVRDELIIENRELTIENMEIFDVAGRTVRADLRVSPQNGGTTINVSHLSTGVYFIKIDTDKGTKTERFIKK